ncbi:ferredoxin [Streptomyces lavendulae]|uniref:ferredoxin n=1 Tax=Streptomyces lavendulae TaxID=1914 RepID=UPI0036B41E1D
MVSDEEGGGLRVTLDRDTCIGAAQCAFHAPAVFDHDDEGYAVVVDPRPAAGEHEAVREAVDLCPARAITFGPAPGADR